MLNVIKGKEPRPRRCLLYGPHGIGKSTWASKAPKPIFIQTEDGLGEIDCDKFPLATKYEQVISHLQALCKEDHDYKTLVIDSLDWLERLVWVEVANEYGVKTIDDIKYWRGYNYALTQWKEVLSAVTWLRNNKGLGIIFLAHVMIEKVDNPETEAYDRYSPKLHKHVRGLVQEWVDEIFFVNLQIHTKRNTSAERFSSEKFQGISTGERIIRTQERPAHLAKNRLDLPLEIPFDWTVYGKHFIPNINKKEVKK